MYDFSGKVVIITGGGRGLGLGISRAFAQANANLVITGRTEATLVQAKADLEKEFGAKVLTIVADGSDQTAVHNTVETVVKELGRIDVLINNAQATKTGIPLEKTTKEILDLTYGSGIYATFYYMLACFPYLKESQGSIINFGSGAGIVGMEGFASYASNKEAIRGLSRIAATEWSKYGINTNVILPAVETKPFAEWARIHPEEYKAVMATTPAGHLADSEVHVGGTCLFLASPAGKMITGNTFGVDGGQNQRP